MSQKFECDKCGEEGTYSGPSALPQSRPPGWLSIQVRVSGNLNDGKAYYANGSFEYHVCNNCLSKLHPAIVQKLREAKDNYNILEDIIREFIYEEVQTALAEQPHG
jgi:hypothetical protein